MTHFENGERTRSFALSGHLPDKVLYRNDGVHTQAFMLCGECKIRELLKRNVGASFCALGCDDSGDVGEHVLTVVSDAQTDASFACSAKRWRVVLGSRL